MPTHWQLVARPDTPGQLGRFMRRLAQRHTQFWHKVRGTRGDGHLYHGRYKAFAVQDDGHFLTVCRYVERNPLRAGLVTSASDWRSSSLWRLERPGIAPRPDPWPVPRPASWARMVDATQTPADLEALRTSVIGGRPFGDAGWTRRLADRFSLRSTLRPPAGLGTMRTVQTWGKKSPDPFPPSA